MTYSTLKPSTKPMKRSAFKVKPLAGLLRTANLASPLKWLTLPKPRKARMKSHQRPVTTEEKALWDRMAAEVGCIACLLDGNENKHVSIHHTDGRTKSGCHKKVLPLCAGHHQDGTGEDKTLIAVHPHKTRFEQRYGSQEELLENVMGRLACR